MPDEARKWLKEYAETELTLRFAVPAGHIRRLLVENERLSRERWEDFSKDDPQSWPPYVHEWLREQLAASEKRDSELRDALDSIYQDKFYFEAIKQCWRCGTINGHGNRVNGKLCEFRVLDA